MHIAGMILGCLLLGQTSNAAISSPAAQPRVRPPEMAADAILLPKGSTLTGQPLALLNVLASSADRRQQLEMTRAYWSLTQAVADYHFCMDYVQDLYRIKPRGAEPASLRLARTSGGAMLREAELQATGAQCELARLMRLPAGAQLPLPADRPHVGSYRTNFQELFAGRTPPEPTVLMDRILPIRRQVVDEQAAAVQAAEDALAAALDGQGDPAGIAACGQDLLRQRRAFIRAVCDYNRNIADYSLVVAGPATSPQALVAMLIGPAQQGAAPTLSGESQGRAVAELARQPSQSPTTAAPAGSGWRTSEPTLAPSRDGLKKNEPTLAPPRDAVMKNEPTLAPPRGELQPVSNNEPTVAPRGGLQPVGKNEPSLESPRDAANEEPVKVEDKPMVPVKPLPSSSPQPRTTKKPMLVASVPSPVRDGRNAGTAAPTESPLYQALAEATPASRAKQLTVALHWDRSLPAGIGKPMSLADCLLRDPGGDRRATIDAYWQLRQRAAEYQVLVQQSELLENLVPVALERRNEPSGAAEMLQLRSAQLASQAAVREAHVALVEAQYALAVRIGATGEPAWPLASTVPHSGSYLLKTDAQPQAVVGSWPVRRLTATIPALSESVWQRASAVVEADTARVAAAEKYRAGGTTIEQAIKGISDQTEQTMAVLGTLTDYNRAIAEYVLAVLPPATPANRLVSALVVKP